MVRSRPGSIGDLIVVGAGVAGLSAAWSAARLGFSVRCLEARKAGHEDASSAGWAKIFRYAYQQLRFAQLLVDGESRWRDLEVRSGRKLISQCEGLNIGRNGSAYTRAIIASLAAVNRDYEVLEPGNPRLAELGIRLRPDEQAVLELNAGFILPHEVLETLAQELRNCGGQLIEGVTVQAIVSTPEGLRVETDGEVFRADRVIVAAGPWVHDLVSNPPVTLTVTAQQQVILKSSRPIGTGRPFSWAETVDDDGYGFVNLQPRRHVIGTHALGPTASAPAVGRHEPGPALSEQIAAFRARLADDIEIERLDVRTCCYTNAGDEDFLIANSPDLPGVVLLSACSGHGFKFALTNGHRAAKLAAG